MEPGVDDGIRRGCHVHQVRTCGGGIAGAGDFVALLGFLAGGGRGAGGLGSRGGSRSGRRGR